MRRVLLWAPLALFLLVAGLVAYGLIRPADRTIASRLVGERVPDFRGEAALPGKAGVDARSIRESGTPRLVNMFASWCLPCIEEAPQLLELQRRGVVIDGIAVRDTAAALERFLERNGDPYARIGADPRSAVQLAFGSSGVPESFVVDGRGVIRHQHLGPIMPQDMERILDELEAAR